MDNETQIKMLEAEIDELMQNLESEDSKDVRERIMLDIRERQENVVGLHQAYDTGEPGEPSGSRKSVRDRKLTPKMAEYLELERQKKERKLINKFSSQYSTWKGLCKEGRSQLKGCFSEEGCDM